MKRESTKPLQAARLRFLNFAANSYSVSSSVLIHFFASFCMVQQQIRFVVYPF
jgi:thiosulfate reductase cytochrome b subunit